MTEHEARKLRAGDQILITATVTENIDRNGELMVVGARADKEMTSYIHYSAIEEVITRPVSVGERAALVASGVEVGIVIAIDGELAWVRGRSRAASGEIDRIYNHSNLFRVSD